MDVKAAAHMAADLLAGCWALVRELVAIATAAPWALLVLAVLVAVGLQEALR
jgi:hypothetical protein